MRNAAAPGILFVPAGRYSIAQSVEIVKPVVMASGAIFNIAPGATLTFDQPISAGLFQIFQGGGNVRFRVPTTAVLPEWFGTWGRERGCAYTALHYLRGVTHWAGIHLAASSAD